jgi:hypothetical protein
MSILNTGAPHFKSVMKQHRHANYTLSKVLNEFIDNIIKKTDEIRIFTQVDDAKRLQEVKVSDNYIHGFDNLDCDGVNNPFNMGHIKTAHNDDSETSEFGVGMKAGALSAANQLNVYTRINNTDGTSRFIEVICDFLRMEGEQDVNASYNPRIKLITYDEYKDHHPFEYGSTLKLSKIRDCIYSKTTLDEITQDISNCVSDTYTRFISRGKKLFVNNILVSPKYDFFEDPKCDPFTISKELFILEKSGITTYIIRKTKEISVWQEFNRENSRWNKLKEHNDGLVYINELIKTGYRHVYAQFTDDGVCMNINTTFTFYSDKYHTKTPKLEPDLPEDSVYIYKDDRNYGKQSLLKHNNGVHNYTLHEVDFVSKRLGKDLGITFNKEILMNGHNDLIIAIKAALVDSREEFTADTSVKKNTELCEKAIKKGIIDLLHSPESKLSALHKSKKFQLCESLPSVVSMNTLKPKSNNKPNTKKTKVDEIVDVDDDISDLTQTESVSSKSNNMEVIINQEVSETYVVNDLVVNESVVNESVVDESVVDETVVDESVVNESVVDETVVIEQVVLEERIETLNDTDYYERRRRTIVIMDHLHKSINGSDDYVLSDEVLKLFESILNVN